MRKSLVFLLLLVLPILCVGCGEKQVASSELKSTAPIDNSSPAAATAQPEPLPPGQVLPGGKRPSGG